MPPVGCVRRLGGPRYRHQHLRFAAAGILGAVRLLGIDHTRLTYRHNGIDRRLTDVHGQVLKDILA